MKVEDRMKLRELLAKATPGPWMVKEFFGRLDELNDVDVRGGDDPVARMAWIPDARRAQANAALIVAAVNALPALLDAADERERVSEGMVERAKRAWQECKVTDSGWFDKSIRAALTAALAEGGE